MRERKAGIQTGKGVSGGRDGRRERCWAEGRGAIRGGSWLLQSRDPPSLVSLFRHCGLLAGCWRERLWGQPGN